MKLKKISKIWGKYNFQECIFCWVVGGGWWVVGGVLFFVHTPVQSCPYTRATRGQASLRSEKTQLFITYD